MRRLHDPAQGDQIAFDGFMYVVEVVENDCVRYRKRRGDASQDDLADPVVITLAGWRNGWAARVRGEYRDLP